MFINGSPCVYDGLWRFMMVYNCLWPIDIYSLAFSNQIIGETQVPLRDSSKETMVSWNKHFIQMQPTSSWRAKDMGRRVLHYRSCLEISGGSRHRKKALEIEECGKPVNPNLEGLYQPFPVKLGLEFICLALPCSTTWITCFPQASTNNSAAAMILLSPGTTISGGIWPCWCALETMDFMNPRFKRMQTYARMVDSTHYTWILLVNIDSRSGSCGLW